MITDKEVRMKCRKRGFTLFELMMTMLTVALLAGIAMPSFSAALARHKQRVEVDALFNAIHLARKESIMRRKVVSLCPSTDGDRCSNSLDWSTGWLMFENEDRDSPPRVDAGEPVLTRHSVNEGIRISANRKGFTLRATFLRATNGTFVFCDTNSRVPPKALVVSYTGRPRVAVRKPGRSAYSCAD